jgi:hypothetical protein
MKEVFIPFAKNQCKPTNPYLFFTFILGNLPSAGAKAAGAGDFREALVFSQNTDFY